jgi:hypothetical protein
MRNCCCGRCAAAIGDAKQFRERANLPTDEPREQGMYEQEGDVELDGNPKYAEWQL